ncbi:MAG: efflux RND transporter periplasmic adaptor subunit [Burkholderiales bacterium]|nr:efflux RND transporter periplasmic adaptor subunit [Burkholderiales bacterium]
MKHPQNGALKKTAIAGWLALALALTACGDKPAQPPANAGAMPPPEVGYLEIKPTSIALVSELPGRLQAWRSAEVRARTAGIVQQRVFTEGSEVKAGAVLYRLDNGPLQAARNSAQAGLAKAEASAIVAQARLTRYQPLLAANAVSKQQYDEALATERQARAEIAAAKAALDSATLNLAYATVSAPIGGRIGRALVSEGALVGQGDATPMALLQQIDPIYVNFTQSSADILKLRRALASGQLGQLAQSKASARLLLEDGSEYPLPGKLLFSDLSVDPGTGAVTLRAEFPNPERVLLPGMYVRIRLEQAVRGNSITVPQQALTRSAQGASVLTIGADGKVAPRTVKAETAQGDQWIISEGLQAGDKVIVEGLLKAKPGTLVKAVEYKKASAAAGAPASASAAASAASK